MSNGVLPAMSVDPDTAVSNQPEVSAPVELKKK